MKEMDRVGFEPTTCGSEEPDPTISTTAFHDWLPSQKTKAIIRETRYLCQKFFTNFCWQKQGEC
jgi:hypothetical protein